MTNDRYRKNPATFGPKSVLGIYLRTMNMTQYRDIGFKDSDKLDEVKRELDSKNKVPENKHDEEFEKELLQKLESGEITQAEYNTMSYTTIPEKNPHLDDNGFLKANTFGEQTYTEDPTPLPQEPQPPLYNIDATY